ncbi:MAG TPA: cation diffusion facilitator family transporter [Bacteroidales bacterium]
MAIGIREKRIIRASQISVGGNALLSVLKIVVGLAAGSLAVVADGVDSASDIITSLITLYTAHVVARPPNMKFPYGYVKADTVATKALAFIIFFAGAQLALTSAGSLINHVDSEMPSKIAVYVIIISIFGKYLLAFYLRKVGKSVDSAMLIANARNMQNDVVISFTVLAGLVFTFVFEMPVIDKIAALLVSVYIMFIAFRIFMQTNREMMDGVDDKGIYQKIINLVNSVEGAHNPHRIRVRKMGHLFLVALDIEVDGTVSLDEAHKIGVEVEVQLKKLIPNLYDVLVHLEPLGNHEPDEAYGVSERDI